MKKLKYHSQVMLLLIALLLLFFTQAGTDESNDIDVKYEFQETTITLLLNIHIENAAHANVVANGNNVEIRGMEPTPDGIVIVVPQNALPLNEAIDFYIELFSNQGEYLQAIEIDNVVLESKEMEESIVENQIEEGDTVAYRFELQENNTVLFLNVSAGNAIIMADGNPVEIAGMESTADGILIVIPKDALSFDRPVNFYIELLSEQGEYLRALELQNVVLEWEETENTNVSDKSDAVEYHFELQETSAVLFLNVSAGNAVVSLNGNAVEMSGTEPVADGIQINIPQDALPLREPIHLIIELFSEQGEYLQTVELHDVVLNPTQAMDASETDTDTIHFEYRDNLVVLALNTSASDAVVSANGNPVPVASVEIASDGVVMIAIPQDALPLHESINFVIELFSSDGEHIKTVESPGFVPEIHETVTAEEQDSDDIFSFQFDEDAIILHVNMHADTTAVTVNGNAMQPEMEYTSDGIAIIVPKTACLPNQPNNITVELLSNTGELMQTMEIKGLVYNYHTTLDINTLSGFTEVEYIYLFGPDRITGDLSALSGMKNLKELNLLDCQFISGELDALKDLVSLERLILFNCVALEGHLDSLSGLQKLRTLSLYHMGGIHGTLRSLSSLPELQILTISECEDIGGTTQDIKAMGNLMNISFESEHLIGNISALTNNAKLNTITLSSPQLFGDISALSGMRNLEILRLRSDYISGDISMLSGLNSLEYLSLECPRLQGDIGLLADLENLQNLMVSQCPEMTGTVVLANGDTVDTGLEPDSVKKVASGRSSHILLNTGDITTEYIFRSFIQLPIDITWSPDGCMYIADWTGRHVIKADKEGKLEDLGLDAIFPIGPRGVAFDSAGNLFINDQDYIFCLDVSRNFDALSDIKASLIGGIAVSPSGVLFYTDRWEGILYKWTADHGSEIIAEGLDSPEKIALGLDGTLYLNNVDHNKILEVNPNTGEMRVFVSDANNLSYIAVDSQGDIWVSGSGELRQYSPDGEKKLITIADRPYHNHATWTQYSGCISFDDEDALWVVSENSQLVRLIPNVQTSENPIYTATVVYSGIDASSLSIDTDGIVYATDFNSCQLISINSDNAAKAISQSVDLSDTAAVAVNANNDVYISMANGEITKLQKNGTLEHYAYIQTKSMVFGGDGVLYAYDDFTHSIVSIAEKDKLVRFADEVDGISLVGNIHIMPALDQGLYAFNELDRNLVYIGFNGEKRWVANLSELGGGALPVAIATSRLNGDIFIIPHGSYALFHIDMLGNISQMAYGFMGYPAGMAVSWDGQTIFIAESGAIHKITLNTGDDSTIRQDAKIPAEVVADTQAVVVAESNNAADTEIYLDRTTHIHMYGNIETEFAYRSFIQMPLGMSFGPDGQLYVCDWAGKHIVVIDEEGNMTDLGLWRVNQYLQNDGPRDIAFDSLGNMYFCNHDYIFRMDISGNLEMLLGIDAALIGGIALSQEDVLYYTDRENGKVFRWSPQSGSELIADNLPHAEHLIFGLDGTLYLTQWGDYDLKILDLETGEAVTFAEDVCFFDPAYLAVDHEGDIWVRAIWDITQITPDGEIKPYTVNNKDSTAYGWHTAGGITIDDTGTIWVASYNSKILRLDPVNQDVPDPCYTMSVVHYGFEASDLAVDSQGNIYGTDLNTGSITKIVQDGELELLIPHSSRARLAVAVDHNDTIYYSYDGGRIIKSAADGRQITYAEGLTVTRMVFGADGVLYAAEGSGEKQKSIVAITDQNQVRTVCSEIDGVSLGKLDVNITPAGNDGLYVLDCESQNLFYINFSGDGYRIANLQELGITAEMIAACPISGDIYIMANYHLLLMDSDGNFVQLGEAICGDPWGMVVSNDGQKLHIAESGAVITVFLPQQQLSDLRMTASSETTQGLESANVILPNVEESLTRNNDWPVIGTMIDEEYTVEVVYQSKLIPNLVRIDQNDQIFIMNNDDNTIYQLHENGEITVKFSMPGAWINCFGFDSKNNLWMTAGSKLYRLNSEGILERIAEGGVNRIFWIDSKDNIIAVDYYGFDKDIQVITPDGDIRILAEGLNISSHIVNKNDEVIFMNYQGQLVKIAPDGQQSVISTSGLYEDSLFYEAGLVLAPNGDIYIVLNDIYRVDISTGEIQNVSWYSDVYHINFTFGVFDSQVRMYAYHGNEGLYRVDFLSHEVKELLNPLGVTMAMAVNHEGDIYMAYGNKLPQGNTVLYKISHGELISILSVPGGFPKGLTASGSGIIYIATEDPADDGACIYRVDIVNETYEVFQKTLHNIDSLIVSPIDGTLWWSIRYDKVYHLTADGKIISVPVPEVEKLDNIFLDFSDSGRLYAIILGRETTGRQGAGFRSLYQLEDNGTWTMVADMLTDDHRVWWTMPVACKDGSVYAVASIGSDMISPERCDVSCDAVVRITQNGEMILIGYDFPYDCMAAACDPSTGDILFCHSSGVYRMEIPD